MNVMKISATLLTVYLLFLSVLLPIDDLIQNKNILNIPVQLFIVFSNPEFIATLITHILEKASQMSVLLITIPGSDCFEIGFRFGAFQRFLFGTVFEDLTSSEVATE
mmetsp:Transcript_14283/g.22234  ORF Transcript_14283/g.22234 Transcript_14283/m.22234 type:complete len:107 (-) Transcript_14283:48-368(-)